MLLPSFSIFWKINSFLKPLLPGSLYTSTSSLHCFVVVTFKICSFYYSGRKSLFVIAFSLDLSLSSGKVKISMKKNPYYSPIIPKLERKKNHSFTNPFCIISTQPDFITEKGSFVTSHLLCL